MFNEPAVSMRELEQESAELLPDRETLQVISLHPLHRGHRCHRHHHYRCHRRHWWGGGDD